MAIGVTDCYLDDDGRIRCVHRVFSSARDFDDERPLTGKDIERLAKDAAKMLTPQEVRGTTATGGTVVRDKKGRVRVIPDA